jgi:hypothetical protein
MTQLILSLTAVGILLTHTPARAVVMPTGAHRRRVAQTGVRLIDFRNFKYKGGGENIRVARGHGTYKSAGDLNFAYTIDNVKVVYGDVTGDGREEAAVVLYYDGGGTGWFSRGFLFAARKGRPALLATFEGGDRADGGIRGVSIKGGTLSVQRNELERSNGVASGLCCPVYWITTDYRFDGRRLVPFGEPKKVDADPDSQ